MGVICDELHQWVGSDLRAHAQKRIAVDRAAVEIIDRYLSDPVDKRGKAQCKASLTVMFDRWSFIAAEGEVLAAINDALPAQDACELLKIVKARLLSRIKVFEDHLAAMK